jgi:hypothetical protein
MQISELNEMTRKDFTRNNINFRIIACKAIEQYKNTQAFVLTDIIEGKHKFTDCPKELMLLMFDSWFRYLLFLERFCLARHQEFTEDDVRKLSGEAQATIDTINDIVLSNDKIFETKFVDTWKAVHRHLDEYLFFCIESQVGKKAVQVFPHIVMTLAKCLNSSLLELHEIDCLLNEKHMILSLDPVCIEYDIKTGHILLVERYKVYANQEHDKIQVKVYVTDLDTKLLCEEHCIKPLEHLGAVITSVEY